MRASSDGTPPLAVLPFANRSASADDEYFSDGLADELLNVLGIQAIIAHLGQGA